MAVRQPGDTLRILTAKVTQPHQIRLKLESNGMRFVVEPNASIACDPRDPEQGKHVGRRNRYYPIFRRAAGVLSPSDFVRGWLKQSLQAELTERFGTAVAARTVDWLSMRADTELHQEGTAPPGVDRVAADLSGVIVVDAGRTPIPPDCCRFAARAYSEAWPRFELAFARLESAGALARHEGRRDEARPQGSGDQWRAGFSAADAAVIAECLEAARATGFPARIDARVLRSLKIPMPCIHVFADGGLQLMDHHRIQAAQAFGIPIEVLTLTSHSTFN